MGWSRNGNVGGVVGIDGQNAVREPGRVSIGRDCVSVKLVSDSEAISAIALMMDRFKVVLRSGCQSDGIAGGPGRPRELIGSLGCKTAAAARADPLAAVGPGGFLGDEVLVGWVGVGAQKQVRVVVSGNKKHIIGRLWRDEKAADALGVIIALTGGRLESGQVIDKGGRIGIATARKVRPRGARIELLLHETRREDDRSAVDKCDRHHGTGHITGFVGHNLDTGGVREREGPTVSRGVGCGCGIVQSVINRHAGRCVGQAHRHGVCEVSPIGANGRRCEERAVGIHRQRRRASDIHLAVDHCGHSELDSPGGGVAGCRLAAIIQFVVEIVGIVGVENGRTD